MPDYDIDITTCEEEPIHQIGEIQSYGTLVAADEDTLRIRQVAANTGKVLGHEPDALLGQPLSTLLPDGFIDAGGTAWVPAGDVQGTVRRQIRLETARGRPRQFNCIVHRNGGMVIAEFVPHRRAKASVNELDLLRQKLVAELTKPGSIDELATLGAQLCRLITGYDRVMIYRLHSDLHGEIIAESTERTDSFLGLHFPASDIPEQARRLFLLNRTRLIVDVDDVPVPITPSRHPDGGAPLDLTFSKLRAVSPMHIQYLKNMGVCASMSNSIVVNGELWGLVACHHYEPRRLSATELRLSELLGGLIGSFVQGLENTSELSQSVRAGNLAIEMESRGRAGEAVESLVGRFSERILALADAQGIVCQSDGRTSTFGSVPEPLPDFGRLGRYTVDGVWITNRLSDVLNLSEAQLEACAGGALLTLSDDGSEYVFFCRANYRRVVNWGGDPNKGTTELIAGGAPLSPRSSFEAWREEVSGTSRPFDKATHEALRSLRRALFAMRSVERERVALAAKALAEQEQASLRLQLLDAARRNSLGELANALAHELNQPLSALMNYVNACRMHVTQLPGGAPDELLALMDESVAEAERAGILIRRLRRFIEQGELEQAAVDINQVVDHAVQLAVSATTAESIDLRLALDDSLPEVWVDRMQIEQVLFNLVRNSIEAMDDSAEKRILLTTQLWDGSVRVSVEDTGGGIAEEMVDSLFDAFESSKANGMGIGLSLCRSIVNAHGGTIDARSLENGAEFAFTLPLQQEGRDD